VLPDKMVLRPMLEEDVSSVLRIIDAHDEDDAEEAEENYQQAGIGDQYVLTDEETVIGVTGFRAIDGTQRRAWLSWTYLQADYQGKGFGKAMLNELLDILRGYEVQKVFVTTSDYVDPEDGPIYQKAIDLYLSVGFEAEMTLPNYYAVGETQLYYGLHLTDTDDVEIDAENVSMTFNHLGEVEDAKGVYGIGWEAKTPGRFSFGKKKMTQFTAEDCQVAIDRAREWGGRAVLVAFPSNVPSIEAPLQAAGFDNVGQLKDYYQDGLHKVFFWYKL